MGSIDCVQSDDVPNARVWAELSPESAGSKGLGGGADGGWKNAAGSKLDVGCGVAGASYE